MGRRIVFPEKGQVRLEAFEAREPGKGELRVRTLYSLMSIGTETTILHARYDPGTHFAARFTFPQLKTGVQAIATVEVVGTDVTEFRVGDRIFMRMAHTSHWTLDAAQCSPVPHDVDPKAACWCGLAKTAFRAAHAAPFLLGGNVLIIGAGPVGQMTLRWARSAGMTRIAVVDLSELRLKLAARGGATDCYAGDLSALRDLLLAAFDGDGCDLVVDTTGNPAALTAALGVAGRFGKLVLLGDTGYPSRQCLSSDMMTKGLTVVATHDHHDRGGWTQRRIDALFFKLVRDGVFALDGLITHEFTPDACQEAYALASDRREEAVGVLFDWTRG
jgi:threonine dehydrogenase-like Zn-dependent dehydrogenase